MICLISTFRICAGGNLKNVKVRASEICYRNGSELTRGLFSNMIMDDSELAEKIQQMIVQHRDLDMAINALIDSGKSDVIQIQRLKKQKLYLRDKISRMENDMLPDIIA